MADRMFRTLLLCLVLVATGTLSAHHNMSAIFDFNQRFTLAGTLTQVDWRNPHIELIVDVKSDQWKVVSLCPQNC
jgi:cell division protein FtsL